MSAAELVSVVMCTYNGSKFLNEQIDSILKQDYRNIELIIVDDCSIDDTWELLQKWHQQSDLIKIFRNEINLGYNKNFEKAMQLATGKFISISDQDDIWLPQKISKTMTPFADDKVILSHCRSVRFENGNLNYAKAKLHYHFSGSDTRKLFFFNQIMGHDMIFRRELLDKVIPIPDGMSYDWWIAVNATLNGEVYGVEEFLAHHRIHTQNNFFSKGAVSKKKELDLEDTLRLFSNIKELNGSKRDYLNRWLQLLSKHNKRADGSFDSELSKFLFKNRKIIFGHKKRFLSALSYLKNSIKYAKLNYKGKGISI